MGDLRIYDKFRVSVFINPLQDTADARWGVLSDGEFIEADGEFSDAALMGVLSILSRRALEKHLAGVRGVLIVAARWNQYKVMDFMKRMESGQ